MWRDGPEAELGSLLLHDVPNQALGHALTPAFAGAAHSTGDCFQGGGGSTLGSRTGLGPESPIGSLSMVGAVTRWGLWAGAG